MSSRALQKAQLRAEREAAERREAERAARRRRVLRLWIAAAAMAAGVGALALTNLGGTGGGGDAAGIAGTTESSEMLSGIPQEGTTLGDPEAELVLTEFADLQCPYCRDYAVDVLPQIIEAYVRPGRLRLDMKLLRFIGPDSERGAAAAMAAAEQDRMWQFVDLWYRNQGPENSGYGDDDFVGDLAAGAGISDGLGGDHERALLAAEEQAAAAGITSTPSFLLGGQVLEPSALEFAAFQKAIDDALAR